MSDQNGFFRFVWRANGLLLLGLLLVLSGFLAFTQWKEWKSRQETDRYLATAKAQRAETSFTLQPADGAGLFGEPTALYLLEEDTAPYMPEPHPAYILVHNVLSVDQKAGTSHWLFAQGPQVILQERAFSEFPSGKDGEYSASRPLHQGIALVVAEGDSNKDGVVDDGDRQSLYIYRLADKKLSKVLTASQIQLGETAMAEDRLYLIYQDGGKSYSVIYTLPDATVVSKIVVPDLPILSKPKQVNSKVITKSGIID